MMAPAAILAVAVTTVEAGTAVTKPCGQAKRLAAFNIGQFGG
jgi:hypothetical protein